jgi:GAF domain-containing protein/HAMP domain-containing protein
MNRLRAFSLAGFKLGTPSLRTRLFLSYALITIVAIGGMGYYVYLRARQANDYLTQQLDRSVRQQAEDKLVTTSTDQAAALDNSFVSMRQDIATLGDTAQMLLAEEPVLNSGTYWNASSSLSRLPSGSWDNPNTETGSVFIPAKIELTSNLTSELNTLKQMDFVVPAMLKANPDIIAIYFGGVSGETLYYPNIDLAAIVPPDFDVTGRPWFVKAAPAQNPEHKAVWSDPYLDAALHGLVITASIPVFDQAGIFRGVIAMDIQLKRITDIVSSIHVGNTGYAFLIDKDKRLIAMPDAGYQDFGVTPESLPLGEVLDPSKVSAPMTPEFWAILDRMAIGQMGLETIRVGGVERFVVYEPLPEVGYNLAIVVPSEELLAGAITARQQVTQVTSNTITVSLLLVGAILSLTLLAALGVGNQLTRPLQALTHTAQEIAAGNLGAQAEVRSRDEIGALAQTFNRMIARLQELQSGLEQQVEKRTAQLKAVNEVGRVASAILDPQELVSRVVHLISDQFGYYYAAIFLADEKGEWATLHDATGEAGRVLRENKHRLRIGGNSMVGTAISTSQSRIAQDVGTERIRFENPLLPYTRSEIALPLVVGERVLGALDVQSTQASAFGPQEIETLQSMAHQVAITVENARLFQEAQTRLAEMQTIQRQYVLESWKPLAGLENLEYKIGDEDARVGASEVDVPLALRDEIIGQISLTTETDWTPEQRNLIEAVATQAALALENARLVEESQSSAARERLLAEITGKVWASTTIDAILQTAVRELGRALDASEASIELKMDHNNG